MRAVVVGYGSIGSRHARLLAGLGCDVAVVSRRGCPEYAGFDSISAAVKSFHPEYVVLARETTEHHNDLTELASFGFNGIVLVEKPLFHNVLPIPKNSFSNMFVAYNLRFHPLMQKMHAALAAEKIISAQIYAGQYLPEWRPDRDYRQTYSSIGNDGGVLRDLSHELDYILWLFGRWRRVAAIGGHYSHLEIDSDDCFSLLLSTEKCPAVSLQLNYLDRTGRRTIIINTDSRSILLDLVNGTLSINNETEIFRTGRDDTYINQHRAVLAGDYYHLCSAAEGMQVMQLIEATEAAAKKKGLDLTMKRICTICARGGSKGVKGKNIRPLLGKPLIAYSLEQAKATGLFDVIAVSSDSDLILDAAKQYGADYCIRRPVELATDQAPKLPVIQHCAAQVELLTSIRFDTFVDIDATSPLRLVGDIREAVKLLETQQVSNVITGAPARRSPYFNLVELSPSGYVQLAKQCKSQISRRQDAPKCFDMNASIYVWNRSTFFSSTSIFNQDTLLYEMPEERSVDIDSELDFKIVEMLMSERRIDK